MVNSKSSKASISKDKSHKLKTNWLSASSLIEFMEKYVEFGKVIGYDLSGCKEYIDKLIERQGVQNGV